VSTRLAIGAVAVLAGMAALGRRGSRDSESWPAFDAVVAEIDRVTGVPGVPPTTAQVESDSTSFKVEFKQGGVPLGYFRVSTFGGSSWQIEMMPEDCRRAWGDLGKPVLWVVRGAAWYEPKLRGRGLGRIVYEGLTDYVTAHGGWLAPGRCAGTGTSADAQRVWQSLRRSHESSGPFLRSKSGSQATTRALDGSRGAI
jgi:hypothetical protein